MVQLTLPPAISVRRRALPVPDARARAEGRVRFGPLAVLLTGLAVVFVVHVLVLARNGEPSGLDFGNWLTFGHGTLGSPVRGGSTSVYPPVVPVLAVVSTNLFGVAPGSWVLASLLACLPGVGVYVVLRSAGHRWWGAALATLICAGKATGEAIAWGGLPQLGALGLSVLTLWSVARLCRRPRPGVAWQTGLLLAATAGTSHLVVTQTVLAGLVMLSTYGLLTRRRPAVRGRNGLPLLMIRVLLPSLPLLPLYWTLFGSVGQSYLSGTGADLPSAIYGVFRETPTLWIGALALGAVTPLLRWARRREQLWQIVVGMWVAELTFIVVAPNDRLAYFLPLNVVLSLALWIPRPGGARSSPRSRPLVAAISVSVLAVVSFSAVEGLLAFPAQRTFYGDLLVQRGTVASLDWVRTHTPASAVIATAPIRGVPFGWWVEGYARRNTIVAADPSYLNFQRERDRAALGVRLLDAPDFAAAGFRAEARRAGVDYLYLPTAWGELGAGKLVKIELEHPGEIVFSNEAAVILKVGS